MEQVSTSYVATVKTLHSNTFSNELDHVPQEQHQATLELPKCINYKSNHNRLEHIVVDVWYMRYNSLGHWTPVIFYFVFAINCIKIIN